MRFTIARGGAARIRFALSVPEAGRYLDVRDMLMASRVTFRLFDAQGRPLCMPLPVGRKLEDVGPEGGSLTERLVLEVDIPSSLGLDAGVYRGEVSVRDASRGETYRLPAREDLEIHVR